MHLGRTQGQAGQDHGQQRPDLLAESLTQGLMGPGQMLEPRVGDTPKEGWDNKAWQWIRALADLLVQAILHHK